MLFSESLDTKTEIAIIMANGRDDGIQLCNPVFAERNARRCARAHYASARGHNIQTVAEATASLLAASISFWRSRLLDCFRSDGQLDPRTIKPRTGGVFFRPVVGCCW